MADAEAVKSAAERVERELGPLDIWINNAMASVFSPVRQIRADEYRRVTEVTYLGSVRGTQAALHRMSARDRGTIAQVSPALEFSKHCNSLAVVAGARLLGLLGLESGRC